MGDHRFLDLLAEDDEGDSSWIDCSKELALTSFPNFNEFRRSGQLCDVVVDAGGCIFHAHRIVLAATIPFFQVMFTTDMMESHTETIKISHIDAETMEMILNFVYTGRIRCSSGSLEKILLAADYFQLSIISDKCADLLKARINTSNVLGIRRFAAAHNSPQTVAVADRFIQKNFVEIFSIPVSGEFAELDLNTLLEILSWDGLHVDSEEQIFEAAVRWLEHDAVKRRAYAPRVLSVVRMPLLTLDFLTDQVSMNPIVCNSTECLSLVEEAKSYQSVLNSFKTTARQCQDVPGIIYAIGGFGPRSSSNRSRGLSILADDASPSTSSATLSAMCGANTSPSGDRLPSIDGSISSDVGGGSGGNGGSLVEMFDPLVGRWQLAAGAAMPTARSGLGVAVVGRRLFAIGGFDGARRLTVVEVFDPRTSTWSPVPELAEQRSAMCVTVVDEKIYVFGGYDDKSALCTAEMYNVRLEEWCSLKAMESRRCAAAAAQINGLIYVMGGHNGVTIFNTVERFNPKTNCWEKMAPMGAARCRLSAVAFQGKIYVAGGYNETFLNTVEVYEPRTNTWTPLAPMNLRRSRVSLVTTGSLIYAIGGYDGENNLRSMEVYNPATNRWDYGAHLIAHEGGVGAGVIPASPKLASNSTALPSPLNSFTSAQLADDLRAITIRRPTQN